MTTKQALMADLEIKIQNADGFTLCEDMSFGSLNYYDNGTETYIFSDKAVDYTKNGTDYSPLTKDDIRIMLAK